MSEERELVRPEYNPPDCPGEPTHCPYVSQMVRYEQLLESHAEALGRHAAALAANTAALNEMRVEMTRMETISIERQKAAEAGGQLARYLITLGWAIGASLITWLLSHLVSKH